MSNTNEKNKKPARPFQKTCISESLCVIKKVTNPPNITERMKNIPMLYRRYCLTGLRAFHHVLCIILGVIIIVHVTPNIANAKSRINFPILKLTPQEY
jgi:hypothetical protein